MLNWVLNPIEKEIIMSKEQKKSLFEKAIDALTDRDEKESETSAVERADAAKASIDKAAPAKRGAEKPVPEKVSPKVTARRATAPKPTAAEGTPGKVAAGETAAPPTKGVVSVRSLRIRADHNTSSEVVGGLLAGDEVSILSTWSDGKDTWAKLEKGWAAMVYDGETYIKPV